MRLLKNSFFWLLVLALLGGLLAYSATTASGQDTVRENADSVRLKFENDRIRVLESVLPPGGKEKMHSHPSYVVYVIKGGKIRIHGIDETITETELKAGEIIYREPVTHWGENIGSTEIDEILIELKTR